MVEREGLRWYASRFMARTTDRDGNLVLYSSMTGHFMKVPPEEVEQVRAALGKQGVTGPLTGTLAYMAEGGFLVPETVDEQRRARLVYQNRIGEKDRLHLIIMPTEQCNFRCVYCYETFEKGSMNEQTQEGLRRFVADRVRGLRHIHVSWFGGEPLLALDVIEALSASFQESCRQWGVRYFSSMTTNGYLLTPEVAQRLYDLGVRAYQITVDGPAESHNERRLLCGSKAGTFDQIVANLVALSRSSLRIAVTVRVNFDAGNKEKVPALLDDLRDRLEGDPRFVLHLHPVVKLGGANDENLPLCSPADAFRLYEYAAETGWSLQDLLNTLQPSGSVCYAANPNSLVVGSDGMVYKCTVAFYDSRNQVGRIRPNGRLELDQDKVALWTTGGETEDAACQACFFRPACQGNACPWKRIKSQDRGCPPVKTSIKRVLQVMSGQV